MNDQRSLGMAIRTGELTPTEHVTDALDRLADDEHNAVVTLDREGALARADGHAEGAQVVHAPHSAGSGSAPGRSRVDREAGIRGWAAPVLPARSARLIVRQVSGASSRGPVPDDQLD